MADHGPATERRANGGTCTCGLSPRSSPVHARVRRRRRRPLARGRRPPRAAAVGRRAAPDRPDLVRHAPPDPRCGYESAARTQEVLLLDVADLDRPNRRAVVRREGGAINEIIWQTRTARLLARYLAGRTRGPVFLTDRAARVQLATTDLDPDTGRARLFVTGQLLIRELGI